MTVSPKPLSFCLCADDYAMTPAVSRGILEALDAGALSATSVMTTSPWWPDLAPAVLAHRDRASIGLHINLTLGAPLGPCPRLAPQGLLPPIGTYLKAKPADLPLGEIEAEIGRQIDAFITVAKRIPTHIDGHQHVHALPAIAPLVLRQLTNRNLAGKLWLRDSADRIMRILSRGAEFKKALGLSLVTRAFAQAARRAGFTLNDGFAGYSNFAESGDYGAEMARNLAAPGPRHLVMCHPGYVDAELIALDPVTKSREKELAFLLSPAFQALLQQRSAELSPFIITGP